MLVGYITACEQSGAQSFFFTTPTEHLEVPRIFAVDAMAWEQWKFGGVNDDGLAGYVIGFSRDASYFLFRLGYLCVEEGSAKSFAGIGGWRLK